MDQRDEVGAFTARHHSWADSTSLKTITKAGDVLPAPLVTFVRSRTVAKVDSMGFVVRRWIQCSAGKSKNASSSSTSSVIFLAALGNFVP